MPTETFNNLSPEKQKRIFEAAVQEFAAQRFSDASINQIIKAAEISRGSFYQYFADKEDLYMYVLVEIGKEKLALAAQTESLHPDADFFQTYRYLLRSIVEWARERPLYYQIGLRMEMDDSEFMARLRQRSVDGFMKLRALIQRDVDRGLIKPEVDPDLAVEVFYSVAMHLSKEYYRTNSMDAFLKKAEAAILMFKEGIARDQG